ncbi:hypothetical protein MYX65_12195 [Acidobacteria bacterium AH-259-L09]|nr:hypothetical protein [Acidobacteria bacterium AH-259-L09]
MPTAARASALPDGREGSAPKSFIVADVDTVSLVEDSIGTTVNSEVVTSRRSP